MALSLTIRRGQRISFELGGQTVCLRLISTPRTHEARVSIEAPRSVRIVRPNQDVQIEAEVLRPKEEE